MSGAVVSDPNLDAGGAVTSPVAHGAFTRSFFRFLAINAGLGAELFSVAQIAVSKPAATGDFPAGEAARQTAQNDNGNRAR